MKKKLQYGKQQCRFKVSQAHNKVVIRYKNINITLHNYFFRYCTEGKRTFGSRFLLDKHVRLHHRTTDGQVGPVTVYGLINTGSRPSCSVKLCLSSIFMPEKRKKNKPALNTRWKNGDFTGMLLGV